ncbi:hypothetical protein [Paenibacillus paeoniae]|uniref:Sporulation protein Cse60 n=1 Tax=Paenibacillus paeoniae TaxID=2292705 RepID=A0A371PJD8_9BACL|nr:hypothetical protein [Paenibacillus paeoniae]REK76322.1 hypothetical protein DX130_04555 [Paenibacillus paeoniae]
MKTQIKLFAGIMHPELTTKVNTFLAEIPSENIVDIKGWSTGNPEGSNNSNNYDTIMIIYKTE